MDENPHVLKEWEFDFTPIDQVTCDQCGTKHSLLDMLEVKKHTNSEPINLRFCNENCANEWYLESLRRAGQ